MVVSPATPEYLKWSKVPITFNCNDHLDFIPMPGLYPLIVCPIVKDVKINRVLADGGTSFNILFLKTFNQMGLSRSLLCSSRAPFHGIVPSAAVTPIGQIILPVTFGTQEIFCTGTIKFEVADFETTYKVLGQAGTLQVYVNSTLRLLSLEDARVAWHHLHQGRCQPGFLL
jgi:hypothetical protein